MMSVAGVVFLAASGFFIWRRTLRYLHIFQQEEYDGRRFVRWWFNELAFDRRVSAAIVVALLCTLLLPIALQVVVVFALAGIVGWLGWNEPDPLTAAKKPLNLTERARRILATSLVLIATVCLLLILLTWSTLAPVLIAVQLIPILIVGANYALQPVEASIQAKFRSEAMTILKNVDPEVIGITGSFGKTSVKHMLGHLLSFSHSTLITPGSVNTVMGISRIIRERLVNGTRFFVVEMGAYGIQSIERLCHLTPPKHGIISAIGAAHYERFKSLDTVARAKFELAEAVVSAGGKMVIADQVLTQPYAREFMARHRDHFVVVGRDRETSDVWIEHGELTRDGISIRIRTKTGEAVEAVVPLYGRQHISNLALAAAMALELGVGREPIEAALRSVPQVRHRLEVRPGFNGARVIDDAYNSNPAGFEAAIEVLVALKDPAGRTIVVTPGMAELGVKHDEEHERLGTLADQQADVVIAVRPDRMPTFVSAVRKSGKSELKEVASFAEARAWLDRHVEATDVVLLENDLPDLMERTFPT